MDHIVAPTISHVEFRPIFDFGDHCVVSSFEDTEYFGVYVAVVGKPASRNKIFDDPADALEYMFRDPKFDGVKTWYNGNEIMHEVKSKKDVCDVLAQFYVNKDDLNVLHHRLRLEPEAQDVLVKRFVEVF